MSNTSHALSVRIETAIRKIFPGREECNADEIRNDPCKWIVEFLETYSEFIDENIDEYLEKCRSFIGLKADDIAGYDSINFETDIVAKFEYYCKNMKI